VRGLGASWGRARERVCNISGYATSGMRSEINHLPPSHASLFSRVAPLDSEIAADSLVVEHMRLLGGVSHLFDRDRVEVGEKGLARPAYGRINHPLEQNRV
jgi:hypothetical protein